MDSDTIIGLVLIGLFFLFMALEALWSANRPMPAIRYWRLIGTAEFVVTFLVNALAPLLLLPVMPHAAVLNLGGWGYWAALPVVVLTTFFTYWSHRILHRFDILWRLGHQLHHGVARVDIASSFIFHPTDVIVQVTMTLLAAVLLGAAPEATGLAGVIGFVIALYQHWNVDTPRWTGFIIQRPEAHMLHHERDIHARNFGDMPLWDMIFGTYAEPAQSQAVQVGFAPEASRRWIAMIACVDVNKARERM